MFANAGLIAASSGKLDTLVQDSVSPNGNVLAKLGLVYPNGNATKPTNMLSDGLFSYCNGVHVRRHGFRPWL